MPRLDAIRKCAEWLAACVSFGWPIEYLDTLEALWWKYHDDDSGALAQPMTQQSAHSKGGEADGIS